VFKVATDLVCGPELIVAHEFVAVNSRPASKYCLRKNLAVHLKEIGARNSAKRAWFQYDGVTHAPVNTGRIRGSSMVERARGENAC